MDQSIALTWDQICAWRLSRQHILPRLQTGSLLDVAYDLIGIHAQLRSAAELALWARLQPMPINAVSQALWEQRSLIKTWAMRGTLHLIASADFFQLVAALRTRRQYLESSWLKYQGVTRDEIETITESIRFSPENLYAPRWTTQPGVSNSRMGFPSSAGEWSRRRNLAAEKAGPAYRARN